MTEPKEKEVQDNRRQNILIEFCGLEGLPKRAGPDAKDEFGNFFELKSTTKTGVSTARDVGLHTISAWRSKYWIIAEGKNYEPMYRIDALYIAHPDDLEESFSHIERQILTRLELCQQVLDAARTVGVSPHAIKTAEEVIQRGATLNNPKIPLSVVERYAKKLDHGDPIVARQQIRDYVRLKPLKL